MKRLMHSLASGINFRLSSLHCACLSIFLVALGLAPPAISACQQISIPVSFIGSWDSHGRENTVRLDESTYPDQLAGKGPYPDRYDPTQLKLSYNVLAFQIPPVTGVVVSAELRLQLRYLVSLRGTEIYQCGALSDPGVKLAVHRLLGGTFYDDPEELPFYGAGVVSILDSTVTLAMGSDFLRKVTAAAGEKLLVQGSITTLDNDPFNQQYLYFDAPITLVLTVANSAAPEITTQPLSRTVNAGSDADLRVAACGSAPLSYQWTFNGLGINAATNPSLVLPAVSQNQAGNYRVVVSNSVGVVTSVVAVLQVMQSPPFIAVTPYDQTTDAGETNIYLRGVAGGAPPPSYQWRFEGTDIPGATNNILRFGLVRPANSGHYTFVASNSSGSITSNPALLTVVPFYIYSPYFSGNLLDNPLSVSSGYYGQALPTNWLWFHNGMIIPGATNNYFSFVGTSETGGDYFAIAFNQYGSVTSTVTKLTLVTQGPRFVYYLQGERTFIAGLAELLDGSATAGPPAAYQWYRNGVLLPGEQNAILTFSYPVLSDAGQYSVVASNALGMATNGPASISVVPGYVNASYTGGGVGYAALFQGYYQGVLPASYQWFYDGTPHDSYPIGTNAFPFNGIPLSGETKPSLLLIALTTNQSGYYAVSVSNIFGVVTSTPVALTVSASPAQVSVSGVLVTNRVGDFTWFSAYLSGAPPPACQWQFNGVNIPGATNYLLALSNVSTQNSGTYSVVASNAFGTATSSYPNRLQVIAPTPLDNWTSVDPNPQANPLAGVAFGNGRRVAVGENGAVYVSTDGQTWTGRHLGSGVHLKAVTFGNGVFVAVGHAGTPYSDLPVILTSPDGVVWSADDLTAAGELTGIAFGNNRFVAIGGFDLPSRYFIPITIPIILMSSDGVNWQKHYLAEASFASPLAGVCFGNGLFIAVSDWASSSPSIFYSTDGVTWWTANANASRNLEAVSAAGNSFIAAGDGGGIGVSSDGTNWTVGPINYQVPFKAVSFGNGTFVAAGDSGATLISHDAISWQPVTVPSVHDLSGLVFGGGQFTAVGDAGRILVSSNGETWADQCLGPDTDLYGITRGTNGFVAVGDGGILRSSDGTNWNRIDSSHKLHGVTYGNGLFVAVGKKGAILTSLDGLIWTTRSVSSSGYVERVIWANNQFVGVGEGGLVITSPDGLSWTKLAPQTLGDLEGIAYGNGVYVAVGGYFTGEAIATVLTSPDGTHWIDQPNVAFFGVRARGVTFANGKFVLVGNDGLTATSTDGQSWSDHFFYYDNLRAVTYAAGQFVAVGNDGLVLSSINGSDWIINRCPASMNLRDVIATPDAFLAVGSNGAIWQSGELRPTLRAHLLPGGFEMNVSGGLVPECRVQGSSDLRNWTDLFIYTNSAPAIFLDSAATGMPARFYRAIPR